VKIAWWLNWSSTSKDKKLLKLSLRKRKLFKGHSWESPINHQKYFCQLPCVLRSWLSTFVYTVDQIYGFSAEQSRVVNRRVKFLLLNSIYNDYRMSLVPIFVLILCPNTLSQKGCLLRTTFITFLTIFWDFFSHPLAASLQFRHQHASSRPPMSPDSGFIVNAATQTRARPSDRRHRPLHVYVSTVLGEWLCFAGNWQKSLQTKRFWGGFVFRCIVVLLTKMQWNWTLKLRIKVRIDFIQTYTILAVGLKSYFSVFFQSASKSHLVRVSTNNQVAVKQLWFRSKPCIVSSQRSGRSQKNKKHCTGRTTSSANSFETTRRMLPWTFLC